jgi:HxlR-like helix-turn-helix
VPDRCHAERHRREMEGHHPLAIVGWADENELRKSIPEITERMLLRHLREMTDAGILERHQERGLHLRVRYSLKPYGMTLYPCWRFCAHGAESISNMSVSPERLLRILRAHPSANPRCCHPIRTGKSNRPFVPGEKRAAVSPFSPACR